MRRPPPILHKSSRKPSLHNKLRRHRKRQVQPHRRRCHLGRRQIRLPWRIHLWSGNKLRILLHRLWAILIKLLQSVCLEKECEQERELGHRSFCFCSASWLSNYLAFSWLQCFICCPPIYFVKFVLDCTVPTLLIYRWEQKIEPFNFPCTFIYLRFMFYFTLRGYREPYARCTPVPRFDGDPNRG